jgi:hypothetical protein
MESYQFPYAEDRTCTHTKDEARHRGIEAQDRSVDQSTDRVLCLNASKQAGGNAEQRARQKPNHSSAECRPLQRLETGLVRVPIHARKS